MHLWSTASHLGDSDCVGWVAVSWSNGDSGPVRLIVQQASLTVSHMGMAGSQRAARKGKSQYINTFQICLCYICCCFVAQSKSHGQAPSHCRRRVNAKVVDIGRYGQNLPRAPS